jgi:molecular chaperone GrpE
MTEPVSQGDELDPPGAEDPVADETSGEAMSSDEGIPQRGEPDVEDEDASGSPDDSAVESEVEADYPGEGPPDSGDAVDGGSLQRDFDALNDRHLRLAAEFNNFRRRNEQERLESWARAQADLLEGVLDVLDDLHRVAELDLSNATVQAIMEGIDLVEKKFMRMLGDTGAEVIDPQEGVFNPEIMEAMMRVPTDLPELDDTVAQVFQKGYTLKGILVRPARVSVYNHG